MSQVQVTVDNFTDEAVPAKNNAGRVVIGLSNIAAARRRGYLYAAAPFPPGADIEAGAKLYLTTYGTWAGESVTVKRVTGLWIDTKLTWADAPTTDALHSASSGPITAAAGTPVTFPIDISSLLGDVSAGAVYLGLELEVSGSADRWLCASEFPTAAVRPYIDVTWNLPIDPPVNLTPDGELAVSTDQPYFDWEFATDDDERAQARSRIQISQDPAFAAGGDEYDSTMTANTLSSWDMTGRSFNAVDGTTYYWRSMTEDDFGRSSDWSAPGSFVYTPLPTVDLSNPPPGTEPVTVDDPTPDIEHSVSSGTQESLEIVLVKVDETDPDDSDDVLPDDPDENPVPPEPPLTVAEDEGLDGDDALDDVQAPEELWTYPFTQTSATGVAVPDDLLDRAGIYELQHRVRDTESRQGLVNALPHAETIRQFVYRPAGGIVPVTDLDYEIHGPGVKLKWTYPEGEVLNYFCLRVDGKERRHRIEVGSVREGESQNFSLWIWNHEGYTRHSYVIEAVKLVGGKHHHSKGNKRRYITPETVGVYVIDPNQNAFVRIRGIDTPDLQYHEAGTTYDLVGSDVPKRIVDMLGGYSGSLPGDAHVLGAGNRNRLKRMKRRAVDSDMRLAFADLNFPIRFEEMTIAPTASLPDVHDYAVAFSFFQSGEVSWRKGSH